MTVRTALPAVPGPGPPGGCPGPSSSCMVTRRRGVTALLVAAIAAAGLLPAAATQASGALRGKPVMDIVVLLRPEAAERARRGAASAFQAVLAPYGGVARPQHPTVADPLLSRYFIVSGVPSDRQDAVVAALLKADGVEAAYVQPTPALP